MRTATYPEWVRHLKHSSMHYCYKCMKREGLADGFSLSLGKCEICGTMTDLKVDDSPAICKAKGWNYDEIIKLNINQLNTNEMTLKGTIKLMYETQIFDSGFSKREIVLETQGEYPQPIKIEFIKDNVAKLDNFTQGSAVEISIDIRGNEYNDKFYVNIVGWQIKYAAGSVPNEETQDNF